MGIRHVYAINIQCNKVKALRPNVYAPAILTYILISSGLFN